MFNRIIVKRCVKCGRYKTHDACLICDSCTEELCEKEWGVNWNK